MRVIPASVRIFDCQVPQDMRRSFDGLSPTASEHLGEEAARSISAASVRRTASSAASTASRP